MGVRVTPVSRSTQGAPEIDGYEYVRTIGRGGFSDVYLYTQLMPRREVAVKVLRTDALTDAMRRQFAAEANLMARLSNHINIASIYDADIDDEGEPYLVMEYCSGGSLGATYRDYPMSVQDVLKIGVRISGALEAAHRAGIVHRDIKPANILLTEYGVPVLSDFGISTIDEEFPEATMARAQVYPEELGTDSDAAIGLSLPWAAPETLGDPPISDTRSDRYSLAATLYSLLEGRSPHEIPGGPNGASHLTGRIQSGFIGAMQRPDVPASLEAELRKAMSFDRSARHRSAAEFGQALRQIQRELGHDVTPLDLPQGREPASLPPDPAVPPPPPNPAHVVDLPPGHSTVLPPGTFAGDQPAPPNTPAPSPRAAARAPIPPPPAAPHSPPVSAPSTPSADSRPSAPAQASGPVPAAPGTARPAPPPPAGAGRLPAHAAGGIGAPGMPHPPGHDGAAPSPPADAALPAPPGGAGPQQGRAPHPHGTALPATGTNARSAPGAGRPPEQSRARRRPLLLALTALVVLVVAAAAGGVWLTGRAPAFEGPAMDHLVVTETEGTFQVAIPEGLPAPREVQTRVVRNGLGARVEDGATVTFTLGHSSWVPGYRVSLDPNTSDEYYRNVTLSTEEVESLLGVSVVGRSVDSVILVAAPRGFLAETDELRIDYPYSQIAALHINDTW